MITGTRANAGRVNNAITRGINRCSLRGRKIEAVMHFRNTVDRMNAHAKTTGYPVKLFIAYGLYGRYTGNFCFLVIDEFFNGIITLKLVRYSGL